MQFQKNGNGLGGVSVQGNTNVENTNAQAFLVHNFFPNTDWSFTSQAGLMYLNFDRNTILNTASNMVGTQTNLNQAGSIAVAEMSLYIRIVKTLQTVFNYVYPLVPYSASYGCPLGFVLCSNQKFSSRPNPEKVDLLLAEKTTGGFKFMDGISLLGIFQIPLNLREAIARETQIYTLKALPNYR